jgi:glycosyltransferase involved in cell wall biosynthesis
MNSAMEPKVSIIVPCYKSESTLEETLVSISKLDYTNWEAILVNDGSPDNLEEIALRWAAKDKRFLYFKKQNGGLGSARNYGLEKSSGEFILPLDSDNKVRPLYLKKAIEIFNKNPEIAVVYGNAQKFGKVNRVWHVGKFDKYKLMALNYIDACAVIKKDVVEKLGGYDMNMPYMGHEDWELWLRMMSNGYQFYYLKAICFDYRVLTTSMINSFDSKMHEANHEYLHKKYYKEYIACFKELQEKWEENRTLRENPIGQFSIFLLRQYRKLWAGLTKIKKSILPN